MMTKEKILEIIAKKTSSKIDDLDLNTSMKTLKKWDSLAHVQIILEIEKNFKKLKSSELMELTSVKQILDHISKKK